MAQNNAPGTEQQSSLERRRYLTRQWVQRHRNARRPGQYIAGLATVREKRMAESETARYSNSSWCNKPCNKRYACIIRQQRLSQLRLRAAERISNETDSQTEERLSDLRQRAAARRSSETEDQREERLSGLSMGAADLDAITAKLLNAGKFNLAYTANKVINAVYRQ